MTEIVAIEIAFFTNFPFPFFHELRRIILLIGPIHNRDTPASDVGHH